MCRITEISKEVMQAARVYFASPGHTCCVDPSDSRNISDWGDNDLRNNRQD